MVFEWEDADDEPVAFQVVGVCVGHCHIELIGIDGSAVAGATLSRNECLKLADLFISTAEAIDETTDDDREYIERGLEQLENLSG